MHSDVLWLAHVEWDRKWSNCAIRQNMYLSIWLFLYQNSSSFIVLDMSLPSCIMWICFNSKFKQFAFLMGKCLKFLSLCARGSKPDGSCKALTQNWWFSLNMVWPGALIMLSTCLWSMCCYGNWSHWHCSHVLRGWSFSFHLIKNLLFCQEIRFQYFSYLIYPGTTKHIICIISMWSLQIHIFFKT